MNNSEDDTFDYLSGMYDFEVTNLAEPGSSVQVVIPQSAPVGEFPQYRKFLPPGVFTWLAARRNPLPAAAALCCILVALPGSVLADVFVGVGAGVSGLDPNTAGTPFSTVDDTDFGYKAFAGIDLTPISRRLAVEAFWADLGQARLTGGGTVDYSLYGIGLMYGTGSARFPRLSGFVEAGIARLNADANVPFRQEDEASGYLGLAGAYAIRRHWFLQLQYDYFTKDAQLLTLSLVRRFRTDTGVRPETYPLPD